jgi:hypothetical protein
LNNTGSFKEQNQRTFSEGNLTEGGTTLKKRLALGSVIAVLVLSLFALAALATTADMFFVSDKNGQNRVNNVQEGDEIWIAVYDPDQDIDCDIRDKMSPDIKVMDPKTGAYIVWNRAPNPIPPGEKITDYDYLEETGATTGLFVSNRSFQIGTREAYNQATPEKYTHVVDADGSDFIGGHWLYSDDQNAGGYADDRRFFIKGSGGIEPPPPPPPPATMSILPMLGDTIDELAKYADPDPSDWALPHSTESGSLVGRFENMDTLIGMYQDPNQPTDVAVTMAKIIDTEATISWDQELYKDANGAATLTIVDADENLNCNAAEKVPVFIIVNPGSWNLQSNANVHVNNFCDLKATGGYDENCELIDEPIRWYNIYDPRYIVYPTEDNVNTFDVYTDPCEGCTQACNQVLFYADETGISTGTFQLNLNSILTDLGFNSLNVGDVLVAYYLDPNDEDDFKIATAYIETRDHISAVNFTNSTRNAMSEYWLGRDPVYVQVIDSNANVDPCCPEQVIVHVCDVHGEDDSEWLILDETSSNSPVFFTNAGTQLIPVWDALGVGLADSNGGYHLQLDNWKIEAFNEDDIYVRYNDVYYTDAAMAGLGDINTATAFPPEIRKARKANDVSFDIMSIADTQVFDGSEVTMYFLDRQGSRVSGYVNSDCVFIEVVDLDQDEDQYRRERIDAYWDKIHGAEVDQGQNYPFGPMALNDFEDCLINGEHEHPVNPLLGDSNIFDTDAACGNQTLAKLYVLNPRNGRWAAVDMLETAASTGDFVSVSCIPLASQYECLATLDALAGDTIVAFYQDPSNHSDSAMISIKVGVGGGATPPTQMSSTMFVDADGDEVDSYTDADDVYVKVVDPSRAGATEILDAVEIDEVTYDLSPLEGASTDTFITEAITGLGVGTFTATYTDPSDPTDTSSDTINIVASELSVEEFYAGPNPFSTTVKFAYHGTGIATEFSVTVYDLSGKQVWASGTKENVDHITWSGSGLANGGYIYVAVLSGFADGQPKTYKGKVFINR